MITLVTGAPGTGKSAYSLTLMLTLLAQKRPLFVHGVSGLAIPHRLVKCNSPSCLVCPDLPPDIAKRLRSAEDWHTWAPKGAVIWWDEVQHIHRPRASGSKVPDCVAAYETHRHRGLDFFMTTQHPRLVDANVRNLVGRHVHVVSSWKGRTMWEWPEASESLANKSEAVKSPYTLPKHVFPLYQSSQLHTKPIRKLPPQLYLFGACILALVFLFGRLYFRFSDITEPAQPAPVADASNTSQPLRNSGTDIGQPRQLDQPGNDLAKFDYTPKLPNVPESAPAFVDLVKPVTFPRLSGCVVDRKQPEGCRCYTQQATPYFVSPDQCRAFIRYGRFDPYRTDGTRDGAAGTGTGGNVRAESSRSLQPG